MNHFIPVTSPFRHGRVLSRESPPASVDAEPAPFLAPRTSPFQPVSSQLGWAARGPTDLSENIQTNDPLTVGLVMPQPPLALKAVPPVADSAVEAEAGSVLAALLVGLAAVLPVGCDIARPPPPPHVATPAKTQNLLLL